MALGNGKWTDFVSDFIEMTSEVLSPMLFRKWSAISLLGGALERRVWAETGDYKTYPNLYVLLVAPPGIGKSVIELVRGMWDSTKVPGSAQQAFHVAPDSMTKASLMDTLAKAKQIRLLSNGPAVTYHSLLIAAEEFSVLLPQYDMEYIGALNSIWGNKAVHKESRRTGSVRELIIENPQLNIIGGAQPAWLATILPEDAWNTGFGRRIVMIYSGDRPSADIFARKTDRTRLEAKLIQRLSQMSMLYGPVQWSAAATTYFRPMALAGIQPVPTHSKLVAYLNSRNELVIKLATISCISRTMEYVIDEIDVRRAIEWLREAEAVMPDIFRAMIGKSDRDVIGELHLYLMAAWARLGKKPVNGELLRRFLLERVPHEKVESIIMAADRANIIARVAGTADTWVPRPKQDNSPE